MPDSNTPSAKTRTGILITLAELADILRVSKDTAYRLVENRELAFHKVRGVLRFQVADVENYLRRHRFETKNHLN